MENREPQLVFDATHTIDLEKNHSKPGDKITYWLTVRDNKEKVSNRFETARQIIEVIDPVAAPEKQKIEKQREERQQLERTNQATPEDLKNERDEEPQPGANQEDRNAGAPPTIPPLRVTGRRATCPPAPTRASAPTTTTTSRRTARRRKTRPRTPRTGSSSRSSATSCGRSRPSALAR